MRAVLLLMPVRNVFLISLRMAWLGLAGLAVLLLARLPSQDAWAQRTIHPQPRFGPPPAGSVTLVTSDAEGHLLAALERQVSALSDELTDLRSALEAMSPLPEQTEFFVPLDPAAIDAPRVTPTGVSPLVDLYLAELAEAEADALMDGWSPSALGLETGPALHA